MPKTVILMRHAKSSWDTPGQADIARPLNGRGRKDAKRMGELIAERKLVPDLVLCSSAERTRETLALVEAGIGASLSARLEAAIYLAEPRVLLGLLRALPESVSRVMLLGHDPGIPGLALTLTKGLRGPLLDRIKEKFPTGALAVLSTDLESWAALRPGTCRLDAIFVPREV